MGEVGVDRIGADLQFENAMAAQLQHLFCLGDIPGGIAGGQGPGHFQAVAHSTAEQLADRQPKAFAMGIEQRGLETGFSEGIALGDLVQLEHRRVDIAGVQADQRRGKVGVDVLLDAFRAFVAIGQTTDGGGFADALYPIATTHPDDDQGL
ncbi:hypothetical protein D3C80_1621620 [compost metagenome]